MKRFWSRDVNCLVSSWFGAQMEILLDKKEIQQRRTFLLREHKCKPVRSLKPLNPFFFVSFATCVQVTHPSNESWSVPWDSSSLVDSTDTLVHQGQRGSVSWDQTEHMWESYFCSVNRELDEDWLRWGPADAFGGSFAELEHSLEVFIECCTGQGKVTCTRPSGWVHQSPCALQLVVIGLFVKVLQSCVQSGDRTALALVNTMPPGNVAPQ